jgi:hypothetical protein
LLALIALLLAIAAERPAEARSGYEGMCAGRAMAALLYNPPLATHSSASVPPDVAP